MSVVSPAQPASTIETPLPAAAPHRARRADTESARTSTGTLNREPQPAAQVCDEDRYLMVAMHLSPFLFFIGLNYFALAIPPIIWLVRRNESVFADDHGRELVNFCLSFIVLHVVLAISIIGLLLLPVLWVLAIIGFIRGAIAAGRGEYFRYPVTIRFLK